MGPKDHSIYDCNSITVTSHTTGQTFKISTNAIVNTYFYIKCVWCQDEFCNPDNHRKEYINDCLIDAGICTDKTVKDWWNYFIPEINSTPFDLYYSSHGMKLLTYVKGIL